MKSENSFKTDNATLFIKK